MVVEVSFAEWTPEKRADFYSRDQDYNYPTGAAVLNDHMTYSICADGVWPER